MASIKGTGAGAATRKLLGIPEPQAPQEQKQQQPPSRRNGQRDSRAAMPRPVNALPDPRRLDQQAVRDPNGGDRASTKLLNKKIFKPGQYNLNEKVLNGEANWTDVTNEERQRILKDPNFYKSNKITEYDPSIQQQILADNNFNWDELPAWQRVFYSVSSNPAGMGAAQGLIMGAGNPGGAIVGAGLGYVAAKSGYDQNKEFWKQDNVVAGSFGLLNWAAEQAEKGIGTAALTANYAADPNKKVADLFQNFEATWNAGGNIFETLAPAIKEAADPRNHSAGENALALATLPLYMTAKIGDVILNPEKYKGSEVYLGASSPIALDETWVQRIENAREEIKSGRDYREVMTEMQTGIMAQIGDMVGQGIADPLNVVGKAEAKVGEVTARISGDKIAEAAFSKAEGISDARARIQNIVNNPAEALKIDPNYKVNELGAITKMMAGLTKDGQVKGGLLPSSGGLLDYTPPKKSLTGFVESLTSLTPESRARTGQDLLVRNLGSIMASYFNGSDVAGFGQWWKAFSKGDMTQSAELSRTMAQSPEFYTVLPAAKGFDIDGQLSVWESAEPARMAVSRIADVLGENPMTFIEDVARRGTEGVDMARIQEKLKAASTPEAKALLAEIEAGRFTEASLTDAVKVFADGSVPFHPGQWMASTLDAIKDHYDQWAVDHFKLDEESRKTLFRVTAIMKSAQSILLLGANPGYMISNVLPTMVTRAASGVYGYMTPTAIDTFFSRMGFALDEGFAPNRLDEGVGPGGIIDQTRQTGDAIREATLGKGKLTDIQQALGKIGSAMPFNKLSRLLEGYEGKMAYAIGIKKFWGESWRRGTGFREIPKALLTELQRTVGNRAADILYSAIESGMTKAEINAIVEGRSAQIQSRGLINNAAQELNIPASKAASMLEQMGILDELDGNLKGATSESRVRAAFEKAKQTAQTAIDQQASRDAIARIEHISNRIQTEGVKAITDVVMDTEMQGIEKWLQHYERMGEAADAMDSIPNADTRNRIWGLKYAESNAEYRRYNAQRGSTYLGILKAVGLESGEAGRGWLSTIAETDRVLDGAYRTTRDLRDGHFKKWNNDWDNPRRSVERSQIEAQIDKTWKDATKAEARNLKKMGELLAQQYEQLFSVEAGEAARQAWEQITDFRKEMTTRRDDFRKSLEGVPAVRRQQMSKDFWQNNYNYMVIEMGRIKQEAISNLDRIANNGKGGDPTGAGAGIDPNKPSGNNPEMEALRQAAQERARIQKEKLDGLWDIAKDYSKRQPNNSSNFTRGFFGDEQHLKNTLRAEEYGGDPTITSLQDAAEKLTPEQIKDIFERREGDKAAQQAAFEAEQARRFQEETANAELRAKNKKVAENVQILQNIRKRGGIDIESWKKIADNPEGYQVGVFSRNGKNRWAADQMARLLADDGYPIDVNDPADFGGVQQMIDLIQRARAGEEIYPVGHEFIVDAEIAKAQAAYIEQQIAEQTFDADQWLDDTLMATMDKSRDAMDRLIENLPEELRDQNVTAQETYAEYIERVSNELDENLRRDSEAMSIAENQVRAEAAVRQQETTATTSMTRQLFYEKLQDVFNLSTDEADTVISLTDARAESWATMGNGTADDWYATRIADVVKDGGIDLAQEVWHGSPHKFDQFTLDHIGSGEGAQAYGWGLYFAGDKSVAEWYRRKLSDTKITYQGKTIPDFANSDHLTIMVDMFKYIAEGNTVERAKQLAARPYKSELQYYKDYGHIEEPFPDTLTELPDNFHVSHDVMKGKYSVIPDDQIHGRPYNGLHDTPEQAIKHALIVLNEASDGIKNYQERIDAINALDAKEFKKVSDGQLYKVEIPDENYLLWDKPLSEQPESVKKSIREAVNNTLSDRINKADYKEASRLSREKDALLRSMDSLSGQDVYKELGNIINSEKYETDFDSSYFASGDDKAASLALKEAGINGIQYLDGSSRGKGEGNYNYVIFDDAAIQVKETFYQAEAQAGYRVEPTGYPDGSYHIRGEDGNLYNISKNKITPKEDGKLPRRFKSFEEATAALSKAGYEAGTDTATPRPINAKGGVQFLDDGKAIIRAFEKADVSTVVHEIGHIFRRDLQGTDLAIIENWAEVKNGQWNRAAEEKFARGFEKYLADGSAPTPKLKSVFDKFKSWMTNIYRAITGSPIDIDMNATVKEVFDRLLVGERQSQVDVGDVLMQLGYDPKAYYLDSTGRITRRPELNIKVDQKARAAQADDIIGNMQSKLDALKKGQPVRVGQKVDPTPTNIPAPTKGTDVWKMTYDEYKATLIQDQKEFAARRLEQIRKREYTNYADELNTDPAKETAKMEELMKRDTVSYELHGDARDGYRKAIEKALIDEQPVPENIKQAYYAMGKEGNLSSAEYKYLQDAGKRGQQETPGTLFQEADPRMPLGAYEESAAWLPQSQVMDEGWTTEVQPLLDKMQEGATQRLNNPQMEGAYKDLSPEGQQMLRQYLNGVTNDMASTKMAAQRWGAEKRDNAMLNYNKRYGFDKMLDVVFPYQFFYTRSMMTWAQRALDKPAWLSNYARIRKQQDRYENNLPERLRGKMRIDAPWMPDWMGDGLYIDPLSVLFTPHNFLRPFEQMTKDRNMQVIEAERILQEWAADGTVSQDEIIQAAQTRSGTAWERAIAEAKMRREAEISNPMDFVSTMFGPAWYLTTPAKLLNVGKDGPETLTELPITRTARAIDTVTNNTWAEPIGNVLGLLAKPEEAFREANNLPQMGEYGDYYTDRNIANMVAEGLITSEEAQIAMIERQGEIFQAAQERTKMELAMRVPLAGFIYAGLNEGVAAAAQAAAPSLFGAGILPEGELKFRGMKDEWNEAWKLRDAGDTEAINRFFEKNPEYEAYLAKGKEPEERLRTFLIGQIWDGYMELGDTNRKQATAEMGDVFKQAFLNSETRAYDTLDIEQLTQWAQMLNQRVPNTTQTAPAIANPRQINYYSPEVTQITDTFYQQRKRMYGDYYELEQGYYDLPRSERASYLVANPKLKQYWDWKDSYYKRYPDLVPVFKGQVFKRIDTTNWPLGLTDYVEAYAFAGEKLPNGAYKALEQVWINEGRPMDDFDTWVKSQVLPAIQYQSGAQMP